MPFCPRDRHYSRHPRLLLLLLLLRRRWPLASCASVSQLTLLSFPLLCTSEEGEDWEEAERRAAKEDKNRNRHGEDDPDDRPKKKKKR